MRYFIVFVLVFLFNNTSFAQGNLVPNPSFEDTVYCPLYLNQIDACLNWMNFGNSPDYFNVCNPNLAPPNAPFGFQNTHSGHAYTGLIIWAVSGPAGGPNYRECIGSHLLSNLTIGQKYYISFFASCTKRGSYGIAANNLGIKFSTVPFDSSHSVSLNNTATLFSDSILADTVNWTKISGQFIADSSYSYIMLGNFFDDTNTNTANLSVNASYAYYYIDDVCVSTDSLYNETWTGLHNIETGNHIILYPNPAHKIIDIDCRYNILNVYIFNEIGFPFLVNWRKVYDDKYIIDVSDLPAGIYFIRIQIEFNIYSYKVIINH